MADSIKGRLEAGNLSFIRRELDRHWANFIVNNRQPDLVRPEILESWQLCRDKYHIDPGMKRSQLTLSADELENERLTDEVLQISRPYLEELKQILQDAGFVMTYFNSGCSMLECEGETDVRERLREINFCPGGNWSEHIAGTNGPGTAIARKAPTRVLASEHYVEAWHEWACYAVPILDPVTGEPVAVLDATGCNETAQPQMLLLLRTAARAIEQDLRCLQLRKDFSILEKYADVAPSHTSGGVLAIDNHGRVLKLNPSALKMLRLCRAPKMLSELPEMQAVFSSVRAEMQKKGRYAVERNIDIPAVERSFGAAAVPVLLDDRLVGAVVLLNDRSPSPKRVYPRLISKPGITYSFDSIMGKSSHLQRAFSRARQAALHDVSVLITGESGTGKEMFAQAIHRASFRDDGPFIAVNCGSIPRELIESELFGYVSGAFTGAKHAGSPGKFELANTGTIFLDEVSELSPPGQVALLRVLQEMEVVRLGSSTPIPIDVRVIAASNKSLVEQVDQGNFRRDLFYRLNVLAVDLPPLRARGEDVVLLAEAFLAELGLQVGRSNMTFSQDVLEAFRRYSWPGNIRELRNLVQRALVLCSGNEITLADLENIEPGVAMQQEFPLEPPEEPDPILKVVSECSGNISEAARRLGLSRMTIYRKMQQNSIRRADILRRYP
jgi:sigma-54 dependent transcriptional regulator, acetoin dehydrogenase operon transcriptional activator AcoR